MSDTGNLIVSTAWKEDDPAFATLMARTTTALNEDAKKRRNYYKSRGGNPLEEDVFKALTYSATGTVFENTIHLVSGASFPDITAKRYFGVEVKSTIKDHWTSTGSSILESSRAEDVERIYMTFGKLGGDPAEFVSKPYEMCLNDIGVTHMPRYKIDMKIQEKGELTIFEKMGVPYDELRRMDNPVPPVSAYYRNRLKDGESLWWAPDPEVKTVPAMIRLWSTVDTEEKEDIVAEGYARFPEVFSGVYSNFAMWLVTDWGCVCPNVRDSFSASGMYPTTMNGRAVKLPAVYGRAAKYKPVILRVLHDGDPANLEHLKNTWHLRSLDDDRVEQWCRIVARETARVQRNKLDQADALAAIRYIMR